MTDTAGHDQMNREDDECAAPGGIGDPSRTSPMETPPAAKYTEQWWQPRNNLGRCTADKSNRSGRCGKPAMEGQRVCGTHGGRAPQARRKAQQRLAEAADRMARELLKMATDENTPEHVKLKAITEALDRAGISSKTSVEIEVSTTPHEQIIDGISGQLEITSRDAYRRSVGDEEVTDDGGFDPLAGLHRADVAAAQSTAQRREDLADRVRAIRYRDDDDVIDAETFDVIDSVVPLSPTRSGGPIDQAMTVEQGNEIMAEMRASEAQRHRDAGHAVVRPVRRALPPGRSQK